MTLFSYLLNAESMIQSFDQYKKSEHKPPQCLARTDIQTVFTVWKEAKCRKPSLHLILLDRRLQHWRAHLGKRWKVRLEYRCSGAEWAVSRNDFYDESVHCSPLSLSGPFILYLLAHLWKFPPPRFSPGPSAPPPAALLLGPPLACPFLWAACPPWLCQPGSVDRPAPPIWHLFFSMYLSAWYKFSHYVRTVFDPQQYPSP